MRHPAKFHKRLLDEIAGLLAIHDVKRVLDPFAGTGRVHDLPHETFGVEIEPEWAGLRKDTIVGSALDLPFGNNSFDAIVTSPCYGNRMADHHEAKDASKRNTYRHSLGRPLHKDSSAKMQWGDEYRDFHIRAWKEATRVGKRVFILNISDHIRSGKVVPVTAWHLTTLTEIGWEWIDARHIATPRLGYGANSRLRVTGEWVHSLVR